MDCCEDQELRPALHGRDDLRNIVWVTLEHAADYFRFHVKEHDVKVVKQYAASVETLRALR